MDDRILRELELLPVAAPLRALVAPGPRGSRTGNPGAGAARACRRASRRRRHAVPAPSHRRPPAASSHRLPSSPRPASTSMDWEALRAAVRDCRRCVLCEQRKQAVFGVGGPTAPWLFVGEGPGADEDEQGEPFVGQAGKLLDGMLAALKLARGREVYIANVVKCRPPGNRVPAPEEAAACARLARPADRTRAAEAHRGARQDRGHPPHRAPRRASRACAARSTPTAASRSSSPTTRPTCCATSPTRRRPGKTCCSRGGRSRRA